MLNEIDFQTEGEEESDFNSSMKKDSHHEEFLGDVEYFYFGIRKKKILMLKLQQLTKIGCSKEQMKTIYSPKSLKNIKATG